MNKNIIAYYRNNKKIEPLYSESAEYFDQEIRKTYIAKHIPLELISDPEDAPWILSNESNYISGELKLLLNKNTLFITSETEKSPYYIFMYVQKDDPKMSRTGILVKKKGDFFEPIIVTINNEEYLVDVKGCGCPEGGYPGVHFRVQAGTANGYHLRVTGGLSSEGAKTEIDNLILSQSGRENNEEFIQIRPLGYKTFFIEKERSSKKMALALRLVPSTKSIKDVQKKLTVLKENPEHYYNILILGEEKFIKETQLPYMIGIK